MNASESDSPSIRYEESDHALVIRLPAPAPSQEQPSIGCAIAVLVLAAFIAVPILWMVVTDLANGDAPDSRHWVAYVGLTLIVAWLLWYARREARRALQPSPPPESSVLTIDADNFRVERAGPARDMDYSWDRSEIADVRLSRAMPSAAGFGFRTVLPYALGKDRKLRISVQDHQGDVADVFVETPEGFCVEDLEVTIRARLGLPDSPTVTA